MQYFDIEIKVLQSYVHAEDEIQAYEKLIKHLTHYVQFRVKNAYGTDLFHTQEDMGDPDFE